MIIVESKKKSAETLAKLYPNAEVIDVTSSGSEPFVRFSPFFSHGEIPVPFSDGTYSYSVEGIWQGLKVFDKAGVDTTKFNIQNMKGLKRTVRSFGRTIGHRKGVFGTELLDYITARKVIQVPTYYWVLENKTEIEIKFLASIARKRNIVLLDNETNGDVEDVRKSLSHAALLVQFLDEKYPGISETKFE